MRQTVRQHPRFFFFSALAGLALRLLFFFRFPSVTDDSLVYGDIARNWLQHGIYGLTELGNIVPTFVRLPGYPSFLAAVFSIFGVDHYRPVALLQILVDLGTCVLIADMARRIISPRAARDAFLLTALCPFLADYSAAALTETLEIFFTALALDCAILGFERFQTHARRPWDAWAECGLSMAAAILLRPDGGLLLMAFALGFAGLLVRAFAKSKDEVYSPSQLVRAGLLVAFLSLAPLVAWTLRNLHTLHRFQPLAPRYATEDEEFVPSGFNRWVKTWMADYVSVEELYWGVPNDPLDATKLPRRAFDSAEERRQTQLLFAEYNRTLQVTPALDSRFGELADQRIHAAPLRYYLWLPLLRIADMWLRPRTELLPSDTRWWEFNDSSGGSAIAITLGVIGLLYVGAALAGLNRVRLTAPMALMLGFVVLRSVFLGSLENPEPRYTLECYPVIMVLAAAMFQPRKSRGDSQPTLP